MNLSMKHIMLGLLVVTGQISGVAYGQKQTTVVEPLAKPVTSVGNTPIKTKAPDDWIVYDNMSYTPVVDSVSRHLDAARKAFDAKDSKKAAAEMRAVADELKSQAARAGNEDRLLVKTDKALVVADAKYAQESINRMNASAAKVRLAAGDIESGKINTKAGLDKAIDQGVRADMERRWVIADVTTWYPISEEPEHHFKDAIGAYATKNYQEAAADIRKGTSYLRLEASRATGEAKQELDSSVKQLDALASSAEGASIKDEHSMRNTFARADHALALEHRYKAGESWAHKEYDKTGYELKAAAHGLESAADWVGAEAKAGTSTTVADTRVLGDKLVSGASWTRDEVVKGFEFLGSGINSLGQKIGITKKATSFNAGA